MKQFVIVSLRIFSFFFVVQFVFSTGSVSDFELLSKRLEALSEKLEKLDTPGQNIATNQSKQKSTTTTEESSRDFFTETNGMNIPINKKESSAGKFLIIDKRVEGFSRRLDNLIKDQGSHYRSDQKNSYSVEDKSVFGESRIHKVDEPPESSLNKNMFIPSNDMKSEIPQSSIEKPSLNVESESRVANEGWKLEVLRELALQNSPRLRMKKAEVEIHSETIPILEFQYFPTLTARAGFDDYSKIAQFQTYSEPDPYSVFSYGLDFRWVLYNGHKTKKQLETAKLEVAKAQSSLFLEEQVVLRELIVGYFEVLAGHISKTHLPKIEELKTRRRDIYKKQVDAGFRDFIFLTAINREIENLRVQSMQSTTATRLALSELSSLLNVEENFWNSYNNFLIPPELSSGVMIDPNESLLARIGETEIEIAKSRYNEIESEFVPTVELVGNTGFRERNRLDLDANSHEIAMGISVQVPIFDYYLTKRKLSRESKEVTKAEINKLFLVNKFINQAKEEKLKLELANDNISFHKKLLLLQEGKYKSTEEILDKGIVEETILLQAREELEHRKMLLKQAEMNRLKQQYLLDLIN